MDLASLFISAFISSTIAPGGSEVVLAYLVASGHYPVGTIVGIATVGNTLGAMTTWALGALTSRKFSIIDLLSQKRQKALNIVQVKGIWALFFSWLPIIGDALCFAGGWLKLPLLKAVIIIFLGKLARYAAVAWLFI